MDRNYNLELTKSLKVIKRKSEQKYNFILTWLMLQTTTDGKYTSLKGAVIVSTVVTTFELMKSYKMKGCSQEFF